MDLRWICNNRSECSQLSQRDKFSERTKWCWNLVIFCKIWKFEVNFKNFKKFQTLKCVARIIDGSKFYFSIQFCWFCWFVVLWFDFAFCYCCCRCPFFYTIQKLIESCILQLDENGSVILHVMIVPIFDSKKRIWFSFFSSLCYSIDEGSNTT